MQALISWHLVVAYHWTQTLLSTKIQLKRYVPNGIILNLSRSPKNYSNLRWNLNRLLKNAVHETETANKTHMKKGSLSMTQGILHMLIDQCLFENQILKKGNWLVRVYVRSARIRLWQFTVGIRKVIRCVSTIVIHSHQPIPSISMYFCKWTSVDWNLSLPYEESEWDSEQGWQEPEMEIHFRIKFWDPLL